MDAFPMLCQLTDSVTVAFIAGLGVGFIACATLLWRWRRSADAPERRQ